MIQYEAVKSSSLSQQTARVVASEMTRLDPKGEGLSARELQLAEQPEDAPLHEEFEWDDVKAGLLWRDEQARGLMRSVKLVVRDEPDKPDYEGRAYLAVRETDVDKNDAERSFDEQDKAEANPKIYRPVLLVLKDPQQASQILEDAVRQIHGWRDRWCCYAEVASALPEVFKAIQKEVDSM